MAIPISGSEAGVVRISPFGYQEPNLISRLSVQLNSKLELIGVGKDGLCSL